MAPIESDERFRHKRSRDPLSDQKPAVGQQPYRQGQKDKRSSLDEDSIPSYDKKNSRKE